MKKLIITALLILITPIIPALADNTSDSNCKLNNQNNLKEEKETQNYISKSQFPISSIDPNTSTNPVGAYYPGLRAGNQLIIYTTKFGERTGTNEFGSEVVVQNSIVTDLTGNNSLIPSNGYVVSGHGKAAKWIKQNLIIGAEIKINSEDEVIESIITPESYIFKANQKIKDVEKIISEYKRTLKDYEAKESEVYLYRAVTKINEAKNYKEQKDYNKVKELGDQAALASDYALYYAIPAKKDEFHGVWLRPTEKTPEDIIKTLDKLQKTGITNVFVETYYHGYTIFPSKTLKAYGITPQRKEFQDWDPLKVWVEEAHKRNMKVHVWFQTFYAGNEDISRNTNHVISAHPNWANVQKRNYTAEKPVPSTSEHNGYFLDPANPQVQAYLLSLISEITNNYEIDGLNIDYIRYPVSLPRTFPNYLESTWGYTNYARSEFIALYGVDPINLTVDNPVWQKWVEYRQSKVTNFVSNLKSLVPNKNILISAVIFPDIEESSLGKLQNWQVWGNNCYVDAFTPLVMGSDESLINDYIKKIKHFVGNKVYIYPGLFEPFTAGTTADLLYQIKSAREAGASGIMIFDYAHLDEDYTKALNARIFQ